MKKRSVLAVIFFSIFFIFATRIQKEDTHALFKTRSNDRWLMRYKMMSLGRQSQGNIPYPESAQISSKQSPHIMLEDPYWFQPYEEIIVGGWTEGIAIGDLNSDLRKDIAVVTSSYASLGNENSLCVLYQNSDGKFTVATKIETITSGGHWLDLSLDVGDINGDSRNDVVVSTENGIGIFYQNGSGGLNPMSVVATSDGSLDTFTTIQVKIADINGDSLKDICAVGYGTYMNIFLQNADGTLAAPVFYSIPGCNDLALGDLNSDGRTDIAMGNNSKQLSVFYQNGSGTYGAPVNLTIPGDYFDMCWSLAIGDLNGDLLNDLAATSGGNKPEAYVNVYLQDNLTHNLAATPTQYKTYDCPDVMGLGDITGDGRIDAITGNAGWVAISIHVQKLDGTLQDYITQEAGCSGHLNSDGLVIGDVNGDGKNDVVLATNSDGSVNIFYGTHGNEPGPGPGPVPIATEPVAVVENPPYIFVPQNALLSGTLSFAPNASIIAYNWQLTQKPAGSAAILSSTTTPEVFLNMDREGIYLGTLTVQDSLLRISKPRLFAIEGISHGFPPLVSIFAQRKELHSKIIHKEYVALQIRITEAPQAPAALSQFLLYKAVEGGGFTLIEDFKGKAAYDPWNKTYSYQCKDRDVQKNKKYTYQVSVVDNNGNVIAAAMQTI